MSPCVSSAAASLAPRPAGPVQKHGRLRAAARSARSQVSRYRCEPQLTLHGAGTRNRVWTLEAAEEPLFLSAASPARDWGAGLSLLRDKSVPKIPQRPSTNLLLPARISWLNWPRIRRTDDEYETGLAKGDTGNDRAWRRYRSRLRQRDRRPSRP